MNTRLGTAVLALTLLAVPARAHGPAAGPYGFTVGGAGSLSLYVAPLAGGVGGPGLGGVPPAQLGPWYLYWPLEAHFTAPAPTGYPYWPSPLGLPNGSYTADPGYNFLKPAAQVPHPPYYWMGR